MQKKALIDNAARLLDKVRELGPLIHQVSPFAIYDFHRTLSLHRSSIKDNK